MARPIKEGLDYLPLDVDFFENPKIETIAEDYGCAGECIILRLFCKIYDNGAYIKYNDLLIKPLAKHTGTSAEIVNNVIKSAIEYEIFDKDKFEQYGVLTSKGIQERYLFAKKRSKNIDVPDEYLLIEKEQFLTENGLLQQKPRLSGSYCNINSDSEGVNVTFSTQSKVKESKVKKSINAADAALEAAAAAEMQLDTQTIAPDVQQLLDAIGKRFDTIPLPAHLTALEQLISECNRPGVVNGVDVVRDGLARLDTAEAIKSGRVRLSITQFLQPKYFTRLISGDYDKTYNSKRKSGYAGAGISFEGREY